MSRLRAMRRHFSRRTPFQRRLLIANAVFHATGARIRSLPISIEKALGHESASLRTGSSIVYRTLILLPVPRQELGLTRHEGVFDTFV
jgi:hypothetical protein